MRDDIVKYRMNPYFVAFYALSVLFVIYITIHANMFQGGKWYYVAFFSRAILLSTLIVICTSVVYLDSNGIHACYYLSLGKFKKITFWKKQYKWSDISDIVVFGDINQDKSIINKITYIITDSGQKKKMGISWMMRNHHQLAAEFLQIAKEKNIQIVYK